MWWTVRMISSWGKLCPGRCSARVAVVRPPQIAMAMQMLVALISASECTNGQNNCHNDASSCSETTGSFTCTCNVGYTGSGILCTDVNECTIGTHNCDAGAVCTNSDSSFTCSCGVGYTGNGRTCSNIDECAMNMGNCASNAVCTDAVGSFTCNCALGYTGGGVMCNDLDECAESVDNCGTNATCTNSDGSFVCTCNSGYAFNGIACNDFDECAIGMGNCGANAICSNTVGSFECTGVDSTIPTSGSQNNDGQNDEDSDYLGIILFAACGALILCALIVFLKRRSRSSNAPIGSGAKWGVAAGPAPMMPISQLRLTSTPVATQSQSHIVPNHAYSPSTFSDHVESGIVQNRLVSPSVLSDDDRSDTVQSPGNASYLSISFSDAVESLEMSQFA